MPEILDDAAFAEKVANAKGIQLVDFFATWCGPCRMMAPGFENVAKQKEGVLEAYKVDIDRSPALAAKYKVYAVPTLALFKDGELADQFVGAMNEQNLLSWLDARI